jgi:hypothetical protein
MSRPFLRRAIRSVVYTTDIDVDDVENTTDVITGNVALCSVLLTRMLFLWCERLTLFHLVPIVLLN